MNSLIKYGLYFVVAFSVLAFGAAEDGKGQRSEVGGQPSTQSYAVPRRSEGQEQKMKDIRRLHRFIELAADARGQTQTGTDICSSDMLEQKQSSLREKNLMLFCLRESVAKN
jgi:hypothetical protein